MARACVQSNVIIFLISGKATEGHREEFNSAGLSGNKKIGIETGVLTIDLTGYCNNPGMPVVSER